MADTIARIYDIDGVGYYVTEESGDLQLRGSNPRYRENRQFDSQYRSLFGYNWRDSGYRRVQSLRRMEG